MKSHRILYLTIAALLMVSTPIASAKFHFRGGPVFDARRFADSVKETAEMVNNVINATASLEHITVINKGMEQNNIVADILHLVRLEDAMAQGKSIININLDHKDLSNHSYLGVIDVIQASGDSHKEKILLEASTKNKETLSLSCQAFHRSQEWDRITALISTAYDNANLSAKQRSNITKVASTFSSIEKAKLTAAGIIADLQQDQDNIAINRLEHERKKQLAFKSYDPYNPDKLDKANLKKITAESKDLGYIAFGSR